MLEFSILGLAGVVLSAAGAGGFIGILIYRRWLDEEIVDLDAIQADRLIGLLQKKL
jgi:hypothetical protein